MASRPVRIAAAAVIAVFTLSGEPVLAAPDASPLLPPDHWAIDATDRLEALGLLEGWFPAQKSVTVLAVRDALEAAAGRARAARPDLAPLVASWQGRLAAEWPGAYAERPLLGAYVGAGGSLSDERELEPAVRPDALHLSHRPDGAFGTAGGGGALFGILALSGSGIVDGDGARVDDVDVALHAGALALAVGRARPGFGFSKLGGVVLSGGAPLDRVELMTTSPFRLPWALRRAGSWTFDTLVARLRGPLQPGHPLLWATSLQWRSHPRLTLGIQRGIMFGGELWRGWSFGRRARTILGLSNDYGNNVFAVGARWRMPTESFVPLTATLDWGTDDDPLAAVKVPGVVAGITAPMLGAAPVAVGVEYAFFGRLCCRAERRTYPWYTHLQYVEGWTTGEVALGDPLGGNGRAFRAHATADVLGGAVRVSSAAWVQDRFSSNLYAPQAGGRSVGARGAAELRWSRGTLEVRGEHERGRDGWRSQTGAIEARLWF